MVTVKSETGQGFTAARTPAERRPSCKCGRQSKMEPTTGIEPVNLFLTKEVLYLLSYVGR